ncbi:MAG TPA: FeoB-associated Cys-rich membrane protein [Candidatus Limosilactobacillus intestinigallinarum]|nr:FeoB-associated Cys-rich membrane protein [Candidatus Limosilactobacillus intestinigallinarum]
MKLLINLVIIGIIIGLAVYQVYRHFRRSRQGKCATCNYDCKIKRLAKHRPPLD